MAYDLVDRFSHPPKYYRFYDPGTYQFEKRALKPNAVPFLSKDVRKTSTSATLWTEAIYDTSSIPHRIQNITSLKSTVKRFPYEAFSVEDLEAILCRCGLQNPCECTEEVPVEEVCQRNIKRRLFKGSVASGLQKGITGKNKNECPPFYDTRVIESTAFYQGCKWSRRTSKRSQQVLDSGPGPTHYYLEREPTKEEICAEKVRALKRKTCKQLRFIEKVQLQNILEGKPGPGAYTPTWPKGTNLQYLGPKAARFTTKYHEHPGPTEYWLRREFDLPCYPEKLCQATLPEPSFFGVKANRFTPLKEQGPSPASYDPTYKPCRFVHCPTAPFGTSTARFKEDIIEDSDNEEMDVINECSTEPPKTCPNPTWGFKSKTIRMKPLTKTTNVPHQVEPPQPQTARKTNRPLKLQYISPFNTSEGRFQPWYNNLSVHGKYVTPGPCYYNLETPKPLPAVHHGPLFRAERFPRCKTDTPAPNEYKVFGGIESILKTHNVRLAGNIEQKLKFVWEQPIEPSSLTYEQRESLLIHKCIALLEPDPDLGKKSKFAKLRSTIKSTANKITDITGDQIPEKPRMLRSFLYSQQFPTYF